MKIWTRADSIVNVGERAMRAMRPMRPTRDGWCAVKLRGPNRSGRSTPPHRPIPTGIWINDATNHGVVGWSVGGPHPQISNFQGDGGHVTAGGNREKENQEKKYVPTPSGRDELLIPAPEGFDLHISFKSSSLLFFLRRKGAERNGGVGGRGRSQEPRAERPEFEIFYNQIDWSVSMISKANIDPCQFLMNPFFCVNNKTTTKAGAGAGATTTATTATTKGK